MPRSSPKTGTANFVAVSHPLSKDARSDLLGLLGLGSTYNTNDQRHIDAMRSVENWLAFHAPAAKAFSNLPKPADYRRALSILEANEWTLPDSGSQFHQRILDTIENCRKDHRNAKRSMNETNDAIRAILSAQADSESRGRPRHESLLKVIRELRKIFAKYYAKGHPKREKLKGPVEKLSDREFDEVHFIENALCYANISPPDNLRRLFVDPEVALPWERDKIITSAARKISKKHKKVAIQEDSDKKQ